MRQALNCPRCAARDTAAPSSPTVPYASNDPNNELWNPNSNIVLEAQLGRYGATRPPKDIPWSWRTRACSRRPTARSTRSGPSI